MKLSFPLKTFRQRETKSFTLNSIESTILSFSFDSFSHSETIILMIAATGTAKTSLRRRSTLPNRD